MLRRFIQLSIIVSLGGLVLLVGGCFSENSESQAGVNLSESVEQEGHLETNIGRLEKSEPQGVHYSYNSDRSFYEEIYADRGENGSESLESPESPESRKIYGALVSHHLLAAEGIVGLFDRLRAQEVQTVVIIGPNHFSAGNYWGLISKYAYETPYGRLEPDLRLINKLLEDGWVKNEEKPFQEEHSISTLVPFVKKTFPAAKVAPIILKMDTNEEWAEQMGLRLAKYLTEDCLVLVSVDFAHHVDYETAVAYDQHSLAVLNGFDLGQVYEMEVDSPASIYALFTYLKQKEKDQFVLVENTNAAEILEWYEYDDVTSYIFGYFVD